MLNFKSNFQGYACKFSPFSSSLIASAFSQYYGIIGNGKISLFTKSPVSLTELKTFPTNEGVFDIAFSEANQNIISSVGAEGSIKLWDINSITEKPIASIKSHDGDIWSICWSHLTPNIVATGSGDTTAKLTDVTKGSPISSFIGHSNVVYSVVWHPTLNNILASTSADGTCKLNDIKSNKIIKNYTYKFECMTCDFSKYETLLAIGLSNGAILLHDLRGKTNEPILTLQGHSLTTRKLQFSPFDSNTLISVGYDMNVIQWNIKQSSPVKVLKHHTEFVYGIDFSLFEKGVVATTGWDNKLSVFTI